MAEVKKPPMMCAVCHQVLGQFLGRWVHELEVITGERDHVTVPVEYDERLLVSRCDFCYCEVRLVERVVLPAEDFTTPIGARSTGNWNTCPECAQMIAGGLWEAVIDRYMQRMRSDLEPDQAATMRTFLQALYRDVQTHQTGPLRPWQPGDERIHHQGG